MISVILYGRNDSHGYNLHKRAAISLNCIAEVLTDADDEIIFVDYNTPDDFITFPEAIADTLTEKCKKLLRIIRVRPKHHNKYFKATTDLVALEPVSRNVGFRASNPKNRWMLCTNTDMVFAPHDDAKSLSDIVRNLPDGFYELPRYEMPDLLWERLDRKNPVENIRLMKEWGMRYHINEILERMDFVRFDAPGDFQLFLRSDIFKINGFDERYNLGWHMDSNLCKRFSFMYDRIESADSYLAGWHCNHTRTNSITHGSGRKANSWNDVVKHVVRPDVPEQCDTWGLVNERLEEIRLPEVLYEDVLTFLDRLSFSALAKPYHYPCHADEWIECPPEHVKPYLADILYPLSRDVVAGYVGYDAEQFVAFVEVWKAMGFKGDILLVGREQQEAFIKASGLPTLKCVFPEEADQQCDIFVGHFSTWTQTSYLRIKEENIRMINTLLYLLTLEQDRAVSPTHTLRKFLVTNGGQLDVLKLLNRYTNAQNAPFGTRIRHGFVVPAKKEK
ncbi:MAG: hypothetical protein EB059_01120 [Alphaproteobacteria bacterium]|nr:hypothetical protein [Alphaproteobacteria bacterium]